MGKKDPKIWEIGQELLSTDESGLLHLTWFCLHWFQPPINQERDMSLSNSRAEIARIHMHKYDGFKAAWQAATSSAC